VGQQLKCRVEFGKQSSDGKALLETSELLFRGAFRLKIPSKEIRKIAAADGKLQVGFPQGTAVFHLGDTASKWADRILHPPSRLDKLGVKPGMKVALTGVFDQDFLKELEERGAVVAKKDSALLFLAAERPSNLGSLKKISNAPVWVIYPKGVQVITEAAVRSAGLEAGLVDVKMASFSATHTALKFTRRKGQTPRG
jgi:hypothetical protein